MKFLVFLSLFFVFIGCQKKRDPSGPIGPTLIEMSKDQAKVILDSDVVQCEGECHEAVGAFYLSFGGKTVGNQIFTQLKLCSTTLVAENKILTNKHCIAGILKTGDLCDDKTFIDIKFPKTSEHPFQTAKCKKILATSDDYLQEDPKTHKKLRRILAPDWALIELKEKVQGRRPVSPKALTTELYDRCEPLSCLFF